METEQLDELTHRSDEELADLLDPPDDPPDDGGPKLHMWRVRWTRWFTPRWLYRVKPGDVALCGIVKTTPGQRGGVAHWGGPRTCKRCEHNFREGVR